MLTVPQLFGELNTAPVAPPVAARPREKLKGRALPGMCFLGTLLLAINLLTGLSLTWRGHLSIIAFTTLFSWHLYSAYVLAWGVLAWGFFLRRAGFRLRIRSCITLLTSPEGEIRWQALLQGICLLEAACVVMQGFSGTFLYFAPGLLPHQYVVGVHQGIPWVLAACLSVHISAALWGRQAFLRIALPRAVRAMIRGQVLVVAAVVVLGTLLLDKATQPVFTIVRVSQSPVIDGDPYDLVWQQARPLKLFAAGGANFPGGESILKVRGVHDGRRLSMLFEWSDRTRSQKHLPLIKTAKGWKVMETAYDMQDENHYVEDKLELHVLPRYRQNPLENVWALWKHAQTGGDHRLGDWQWRSVCRGTLGQGEQYDKSATPQLAEAQRRYRPDDSQALKEPQGCALNWTKRPGSPFVVPHHLPRDAQRVRSRLGLVNLDPRIGDYGQWWMALEDTVPYAPERDTYPIGTVLPSVLVDRSFVNEREDTIRGVGTWENGWWRLEVTRELQSGASFALPLQGGAALWLAVFDHSQTRPSHHWRPVRLVLE